MGLSLKSISNPISPSSGMNRMRDSNSEAKNHTRRLSNSRAPRNETCSTTTAASSVGSATRRRPRMTTLPGISMITPSATEMSVGVPQPILAIGPMRNMPSRGGKIARRSLRILGAFSMMFVGKRMLLMAPVRIPLASGSRSMPRLRPRRPPTPIRVKPYPSWKPGLNSAVMMASSENPGWPPGSLVVISPMALSDSKLPTVSSSAPAYSPFSKSR